MRTDDVVLILDFGGQYTQLIARRVRECRVRSEIVEPGISAQAIRERAPKALILSGGPDSVYREGAPQLAPGVLDLGLPTLGICYGMQLIARDLGGRIERAHGEYGHADVEIDAEAPLFRGLSAVEPVWMSHGDHVSEPPPGGRVIGRSPNVPVAAFDIVERRIAGIQFHPEVAHTARGTRILENFLFEISGCQGDWTTGHVIAQEIAAARARIGDDHVLCGISGGVDSAVAALLLHQAIGDRLHCVFVDNGLLRKNEAQAVMEAFRSRFHVPVRAVDASGDFLGALAGVTDPEQKRKIVGRVFVEVFEREARAVKAASGKLRFLAQGTLYPDVIESSPVRGPSAVIKSHHNVGGLPQRMALEVVEPLRWLFKDEVRKVGAELGLSDDFVNRHPFPGPGLSVRCVGEVTRERLAALREADDIFMQELRSHDLHRAVSQAFAVLLPVRAVGVMGDERTYDEACVLRCVETADFMTATWSRLPHEVLARAAGRIVNEVRGINRVLYDVTSKPPGTIEWE